MAIIHCYSRTYGTQKNIWKNSLQADCKIAKLQAMRTWDYKNIAVSKASHRKLAELSLRLDLPIKELAERAIDRLVGSHEPKKRKGKT